MEAALRNFDVLCDLVKDKQVTTEYGVILMGLGGRSSHDCKD
jgi:hypothetical protein